MISKQKHNKVPKLIFILVVIICAFSSSLIDKHGYIPFFKLIRVQAAGPNDYFDALIARPDYWKGYSLRPRTGEPITSPYYANQLLQRKFGGYADCNSCGLHVTYQPSTDMDPNRQDAAKVVIPAFSEEGPSNYLSTNIDGTQTVFVLANTFSGSSFFAGRAIKIDNEIMMLTVVDIPTKTITATRGQLGTLASTHTGGIGVFLNVNSLQNSPFLPLNTVDGNTYLFTWDTYWTSSYINSGLTNHKSFNFRSPGIWLEPNANFAGGDAIAVRPPGFNKATDVAAFQTRSYNSPGGDADWTKNVGSFLGPGVTSKEPLLPQLNTFIIKPNRWVRFWYEIEQRANDYDYLNVWVADESNNPVKIFEHMPLSVGPAATIVNLQIEFNTSTDRFVRGDSRDLVAYVKNFAVLKNPGDVSALLLRPISGGVPPPPSTTPIIGDINLDHIVNAIDYSILNSKWFTTDTNSDLNKDGIVNAIDFSMLNANWFKTW